MDVCDLERHGFRRTPVGDPYPTGTVLMKPLPDGTELWIHTVDMKAEGDPWANIWVAGRFSMPRAYIGIEEPLMLMDAYKLSCFLPNPDRGLRGPTIPAAVICQLIPSSPDDNFRYHNKPGGAHYA